MLKPDTDKTQHLHKRRSGHEQILVMFEDLAVTTNLPCAPQQTQSEHYSSFVLQLFAELATRLLDLALALEKYPQGKSGHPPKQMVNKATETSAATF